MNQPLILLVDDVDFFLEVEKGFLRRTRCQIIEARNGRDALELARTRHPDLVYLDVNMPLMDGLTCCRTMKNDPQLAEIPVIMVYSPSKEVDEEACRQAGSDGILRKPLDRKSFLELGRQFLFAVDRREQRIPCQMTVDFTIDSREGQGMGLDISRQGLYVGTREPVAEDDRVKVDFFLPGVSSSRLRISGRVAWVNQGFPRPNLNLPQGFGVEFRLVSTRDAGIISDYIRQYHSPAGGCAGKTLD